MSEFEVLDETLQYPFDSMHEASRTILNHTQNGQTYYGYLQRFLNEMYSLPSDIGPYIATAWSQWNTLVQVQQGAYDHLAATITEGATAMDDADQQQAQNFQGSNFSGFQVD